MSHLASGECSIRANGNPFVLNTAVKETGMNPKDALREEHGETMKMLAVVVRFMAKLVDLKEGDTEDMEAFIDFFENYVDLCHHGKEEQVLFPALSRVRTAEIDSLIDSLMQDHREARNDMEQIKALAAAVNSCSGVDRNKLSESTQRYVELVRKHIRKENSELLPLIEDRLSETERFQMAGQFSDVEKATLGSSGNEIYLSNTRRLSQKYPHQ